MKPDRFFRPLYVGGRGWIGVRLDGDGDVDWDGAAAICAEHPWRSTNHGSGPGEPRPPLARQPPDRVGDLLGKA